MACHANGFATGINTCLLRVCANSFRVNFSSAEPCSEVSGSWYGRLSQCCGILVADSVFITQLVQVSGSSAYCKHTCTFLDILGILTRWVCQAEIS